jgi:3-methyl-2-oxobutanoate hydroxymethyltransferase
LATPHNDNMNWQPKAAESRPARLSVPALAAMARDGQKIAMLTAYDASFAAIAERAGIDVLLIGDSLGMVIQGHDSTLPVTLGPCALSHALCRGRVQRGRC